MDERAFGYHFELDKPIPARVRAHAHKPLSALSDGHILATPSHAHLRGSVQNQRTGEACVAFALSKCAWRNARLRGVEDAVVPSPLHIWTIGRRAFSGPDGELTNDGTYPRVVVAAVRDVGLVPAAAWPYNEDLFNTDIPARVHRLAYDAAGMQTYRIDSTDSDRLREMGDAMMRGATLMMALRVDAPFRRFTGNDVIERLDHLSAVGDHMVSVLAIDDDSVLIENSWGHGWGIPDGDLVGCARLSLDLVANSAAVLEILAVNYAPEVL